MEFLWANRHMPARPIYRCQVLRVLHWLGQANRRPAFFIVEIVAALLSVMALRDGILVDPMALPEALSGKARGEDYLTCRAHSALSTKIQAKVPGKRTPAIHSP
jgi:hypothetical protein